MSPFDDLGSIPPQMLASGYLAARSPQRAPDSGFG